VLKPVVLNAEEDGVEVRRAEVILVCRAREAKAFEHLA
jgi:hypothetical protein